MFPDHKEQLVRLNKIEGQVRGIKKMVEDRRYCMDIIAQVRAVASALKKIELGVMEGHIQHCVKSAIEAKDQKVVDEKMAEIMSMVSKMP